MSLLYTPDRRPIVAVACALVAALTSLILVQSSATGQSSGRPTRMDVTFAQMMSRHHVQGIANAKRAAEKATNPRIRELARKQVTGQTRERGQLRAFLRRDDVPDVKEPSVSRAQKQHDAWELRQLDAAQGEEFDRLFLMFQIDHHLAGTMMARMEARNGSSSTTRRLATRINKAQTVETGEMEKLAGIS